MKTGSLMGVLLTGLFAIGAAAQTTSVTSTSTITFPLSLSASAAQCAENQLYDECTVECVDFTGNLQVQMTTFSDADGNHIRISLPLVNVDGTGVTTGADYHLISQTKSISITHDDLAGEETQIFRFKLIGAGPVANEQMYMTDHITVNANGVSTAFVEKPGPTNPSFKCTGN